MPKTIWAEKDVTSNQYDFAGRLLQTVRKHSTASTADIYILSRFQYDHAGRILSSTYGVGEDFTMADKAEIILSANEYSQLGQLIEKKLHSININDDFKHYLQNVDYKYNIRGWMTDINDVNFGGLTPSQMAEEVNNGLIEKIKDSDIEIELSITDLNAGIYDEVEVRNEREEERDGQTEQRVEEETRELENNTTLQSALTNVLSIDYTGQELTEANYQQEISKLRTDLDTQMDNLGITDQKARDLVEEEVMSYFADNWVKTVANDNDNDLFAMHFDYTTGNTHSNTTAQFNGNISQVTWRVRGDDNKSVYGFQYDKLNRLTNAKYIEYAPSGLYTNTDNYTVSGINYDLNGNIQQLNRRGFNGSGFSQIDQMSYIYENNSNILKSVSDAAQVTDRGFKEIGNNTIDYQYDDNGNLTRDNNKGIDIFYNHLNLPNKVSFDSGEEIEWLYDAAGIKLVKYTDDGQGNTTEKNYVGGIEYVSGDNGYEVEAIYHSEGRLVPKDGGKYQFEYTLTDHLGNARVTFADLNDDATVDETEILQTNHYYPFGMRHEGNQVPLQGSENMYQFNGTEHIADFDIDWNHTLFRTYDNAIGRWHQIDPKHSERESPFVGLGNNPVIYSDLLGDTLRGVNISSAYRTLSEIQNIFSSVKDKNGTMVNAEKLKKLFKVKGKTFQTINYNDFAEAVDGLSTDTKALALAYFIAINDDQTHITEIIDKNEELSDYGKRALGLEEGVSFKGGDIDGGGHSESAFYEKGIVNHENTGLYMASVRNPSSNSYYTKGKNASGEFIMISQQTTVGEILTHELGHSLGYWVGMDADLDESVQYTNIYLRATGKPYYRLSHGVSNHTLSFDPNDIPIFLRVELNRINRTNVQKKKRSRY